MILAKLIYFKMKFELNSLKTEGAGFGHDTNLVHVINRDNQIFTSGLLPKTEIAQLIWDQILAIIPA
jgi:hypothetical protein